MDCSLLKGLENALKCVLMLYQKVPTGTWVSYLHLHTVIRRGCITTLSPQVGSTALLTFLQDSG